MNPELFFENFELLAESPNGIQKLREMILQMAVQGKLVVQDPDDEPAEVLLERIKAEKERLVKEKKIKKQEELPLLDNEDVPYEIPKNWNWTYLGQIGQIVGGGTPKTNNPDYFSENEISWLTPADLYSLKKKYIGKGKRDITEIGLKNSSTQLMPTGTVLFSSRAPIGYVAIASNDLATNQGFKSCVPFIMEMNEYIYYFLKSAVKEIENNASGTTFKEVSGKIVSQIKFPLPPLEEQKRIVAKVDQLMALCDQLESLQQKKNESCIQLNNSALNKMLDAGSPEGFAEHWQLVCENFDLLYDDLDNVEKLKQAILQLAVQGKLVEQDVRDEPAGVLFENIRNEKDAFSKINHIKLPKFSSSLIFSHFCLSSTMSHLKHSTTV
ncbi:restriction endonuclease subunit S [Methanococcoides sp. NM1]|uniref:restriction endonuclease subunit S n=1 Tax=Methanococcoides sp. NM1 TaxID=1201013 RepID=UPI0010831D08|nr:restriction endonuclease subunit S [Methanococcoides sp. NM1]